MSSVQQFVPRSVPLNNDDDARSSPNVAFHVTSVPLVWHKPYGSTIAVGGNYNIRNLIFFDCIWHSNVDLVLTIDKLVDVIILSSYDAIATPIEEVRWGFPSGNHFWSYIIKNRYASFRLENKDTAIATFTFGFKFRSQ